MPPTLSPRQGQEPKGGERNCWRIAREYVLPCLPCRLGFCLLVVMHGHTCVEEGEKKTWRRACKDAEERPTLLAKGLCR